MRCEFTYEMTPQVLRPVIWRILFRRYRILYLGAIVFLLLAGMLYSSGESWLAMWLLIVAGIYLVLLPIRFWQSMRLLNRNPDRVVTVRLEPESITFEARNSLSTLKWEYYKRLWSCPDAMILFSYHPWIFWIVPTGPIGEDGRMFIEDQIRSHGGKIL
jgi:hypothetical protein